MHALTNYQIFSYFESPSIYLVEPFFIQKVNLPTAQKPIPFFFGQLWRLSRTNSNVNQLIYSVELTFTKKLKLMSYEPNMIY